MKWKVTLEAYRVYEKCFQIPLQKHPETDFKMIEISLNLLSRGGFWHCGIPSSPPLRVVLLLIQKIINPFEGHFGKAQFPYWQV